MARRGSPLLSAWSTPLGISVVMSFERLARFLPRARWRRQLALRARATLATGITGALLSAALAGVAYGLVRDHLLDERESAAMRQAYTNARLVRTGLGSADADVPRLLAGIQMAPRSEVVLRVGNRWFSTSVTAGRDVLPSELAGAVAEGHAGRQKFRHGGEPFLAVGVPIPALDGAYFELISLGDIDRTLNVLGSSLLVAGAVGTAVAAAVGAWTSRAVLRPIRAVAGVARRIVGGELDSRLEAQGDPDLAPLAASFNEMLDDLRERIRREARFAADVSHDLRGSVAALASAVAVVERRRHELPDGVVHAVEALDEHVRSFNQLVLDLLEISRFDAGAAQLQLGEVHLERLARDVLQDRGRGEVPIRVLDHVPAGARVDPRRLHQVIANLVDNAERYGEGVVAIEINGDHQTARVAIDDAGPGVPEGERAAIFERFARGTAAGAPGAPKGTGLGLALVAEHVGLHGGRVWVEDRPGGGARFVVQLPRMQP